MTSTTTRPQAVRVAGRQLAPETGPEWPSGRRLGADRRGSGLCFWRLRPTPGLIAIIVDTVRCECRVQSPARYGVSSGAPTRMMPAIAIRTMLTRNLPLGLSRCGSRPDIPSADGTAAFALCSDCCAVSLGASRESAHSRAPHNDTPSQLSVHHDPPKWRPLGPQLRLRAVRRVPPPRISHFVVRAP